MASIGDYALQSFYLIGLVEIVWPQYVEPHKTKHFCLDALGSISKVMPFHLTFNTRKDSQSIILIYIFSTELYCEKDMIGICRFA